MALALRVLVGADGAQPGVLARGARVGLERHAGEAGDLAQDVLEGLDELGVALRLLGGREGVDAVELGPGDRDHLGRGVELHRARAEGDHAVDERDVALRQLEDVTQHLVLRLVVGEDGVRHEGGRAPRRRRQRGRLRLAHQVVGGEGGRLAEAEGGPHGGDVVDRGRLVARERELRLVEQPEVDALLVARLQHLLGRDARGRRDADGVEEGRVGRGAAEALEAGEHERRAVLAVRRDLLEALGAVVHAVERRDVGEQRLRGADVGGGLVAPDVLLARLHGHAVRGLALCVDGHADDATRHLARLVRVGARVRGEG